MAEFLNFLTDSARAKVVRHIELLATYGVLLKEPYTKQIRGKLREIRVKDDRGAVRVFYFGFAERRFILLHGFIKKTEKTSKREIEIAERRMKDFIDRFGKKP